MTLLNFCFPFVPTNSSSREWNKHASIILTIFDPCTTILAPNQCCGPVYLPVVPVEAGGTDILAVLRDARSTTSRNFENRCIQSEIDLITLFVLKSA